MSNNNTLEFYLKLKDMMSSGLARVGQSARVNFATVQTAANRAQTTINTLAQRNTTLASSYDMLRNKASQLEKVISSSTSTSQIKAATKELRELNREIERHIGNPNRNGSSGSSGGGMLNKMGFGGMFSRFAPAALVTGGLMLAGSSVNAAMNFGATNKSYEVLAGNASKGRELASGLNKLQQDTILGPEVFKAGQTLMGFGIASERVMPIVKQLGDVAMGDSQRFESLTLAFAQTQAAGKLMGQDLLQYINAGFNPLQTMSEKWQEFGFKQKMSVGQLKEAMEKGAISSSMVAKAFEIATNKGGKFANMMDTIGQTAYGKMKVMEGQWEAFKIKFGGWLMPIATTAMEAATGILGIATAMEKASSQATVEQAKIGQLVTTITALNEGSELRKTKLQELVQTYPDLFGKIDIEKIKNSELLNILGDVNKAYDKRISLATSREVVDSYKGKIKSQESRAQRMNLAASLLDAGHRDEAYAVLEAGDVAKAWLFGASNERTSARLKKEASQFQGAADSWKSPLKSQEEILRIKEFKDIWTQAKELAASKNSMQERFGKNTKAQQEFTKELGFVNSLKSTSSLNKYDINILKNKMFPTKAVDTSATDAAKVEAGAIGKSVASGGVRTINIHGVKFTDKVEVHAATLKEGVIEIQKELEDMFLRILNSGATVQG